MRGLLISEQIKTELPPGSTRLPPPRIRQTSPDAASDSSSDSSDADAQTPFDATLQSEQQKRSGNQTADDPTSQDQSSQAVAQDTPPKGVQEKDKKDQSDATDGSTGDDAVDSSDQEASSTDARDSSASSTSSSSTHGKGSPAPKTQESDGNAKQDKQKQDDAAVMVNVQVLNVQAAKAAPTPTGESQAAPASSPVAGSTGDSQAAVLLEKSVQHLTPAQQPVLASPPNQSASNPPVIQTGKPPSHKIERRPEMAKDPSGSPINYPAGVKESKSKPSPAPELPQAAQFQPQGEDQTQNQPANLAQITHAAVGQKASGNQAAVQSDSTDAQAPGGSDVIAPTASADASGASAGLAAALLNAIKPDNSSDAPAPASAAATAPLAAPVQTPPATTGAENAAPAHETPRTEPADPLDQVILGLKGKMDARTGKAEIRLDPPNLGAVKVSLSLENGTLTADFQSSSDVVRDLLKGNLEKLKTVLESQGLAVDRLAVDAPPAAQADSGATHGQQSSFGSATHDGRSAGQYQQDPRSGQRRTNSQFEALFRQRQDAPIDLVA